MKDLFISYGRRESLVFVGRLHQLVKLAGYEAWFDKVNIPDGDDYSQRIWHGIESAHNFAYVMAPRCMTSPYCLVELEYARLLGKRIIPLAQIVLFDTPPKELSAGDKQVMINFYQTYGIKGVEINTELDVLKRSHALLGKADWVYAREEYTPEELKAIFDWQASYENSWFKHDQPDYLKSYKFPTFGKSIDDLESVVEAVLRLVGKHKDYVQQQTIILQQALRWQKGNKEVGYLLVGADRKKAEEWILTDFVKPDLPPCNISNLHGEFICESRKNAENLLTDVFISYDTESRDLRDEVYHSLSQHLVTTWLHHKDIAKGKNFEEAIFQGIEQSKYMLFFITNASLQSDWCLKELHYANSLNKKIIPLLIENLENPRLLQENPFISKLQYIDFTNNTNPVDYERDLADILKEIHTEDGYYEQHRTFLCQALKWQRQNYNDSILLQGNLLANARNWLKAGSTKPHKPLPLHQQFIEASIAKIGNLNSDVFVSYSRNDGDFARKINTDLQTLGTTTWFDQESIPVGATNFEEEIRNGIAQSDNFLFLISPKSINSPYCKGEVEYAVQLNKRISTVLVETLDNESKEVFKSLPKLSQVQWIDLRPSHSYEKGFEQLYRSLKSDAEYVKSHTNWGRKAADWSKYNQKTELLLRGAEVASAEAWLAEAVQQKKYPEPTDLQQKFIAESRKAVAAARKKEINTIRQLRGLFGFSMVALVVSLVAYLTANMQKDLSETNFLLNIAQRNVYKDAVMSVRAAEIVYQRGQENPNNHFTQSAVDVGNLALATLKESADIYGMLYNSNKKELVLSANQQEIYEYSTEKEKVGAGTIRVLDTNFVEKLKFSVKQNIEYVLASPDNKYLLVKSETGFFSKEALQLYTNKGEFVRDFESSYGENVHFSADGKKIIFSGNLNTVYDIATKKSKKLTDNAEFFINISDVLTNNLTHALVQVREKDETYTMNFWNMDTWQAEWKKPMLFSSAVISKDGEQLIGYIGDTITSLNRKGEQQWSVKTGSFIQQIKLNNNDKELAAVLADSTLYLLPLKNFADSLRYGLLNNYAEQIEFAEDTLLIVRTLNDVIVFNTKQGYANNYFYHDVPLKWVKKMHNSPEVLTFDNNYNLRFWQLNSSQHRAGFKATNDANELFSTSLPNNSVYLPTLDIQAYGISKTTFNDVLMFYTGLGVEEFTFGIATLFTLALAGFAVYSLFKRRWKKMFGYGFLVNYIFFLLVVYFMSFFGFIFFLVLGLVAFYFITKSELWWIWHKLQTAFLPKE